MLKKCITLLLLTVQTSTHTADKTNLIYIDVQDPFTRKVQSTIPMPITDDTTFAELQTKLNNTLGCYTPIENLRYPNVDYSHSNNIGFINAHTKVKNCMIDHDNMARFCLGALLPYPSGPCRTRTGKSVV